MIQRLLAYTLFVLLLPCFGALAAEEGPASFPVNDLTFTRPDGWKWQQPTSSMRKAQLSVPGKDGEAELVFFYFGPGGAGGVQANVDRWIGQFQDVHDKKSEEQKIGGIDVTFVEAAGTYMSGPPFGQKVPKEGYALRGAIVSAKGGAIFIKMTGPAKTVADAAGDFMKMTERALK